MMHGFVILTPVLLLAVVALLGFAGCEKLLGLNPITPVTPVTHVQTVVKTAAAGTDTITADPLTLRGGELIIATLQWRSGALQQPAPILTGGSFGPVSGGGPFNWNSMNVQSFFGFNPQGSTSLTVKASVTGGSNIEWNLCVSAYEGIDLQNPLYSPQQNGPAFSGTNPQTPAISIGAGDLVHAVAFAANGSGTFPGTVFIAPGPKFQAEGGSNPLVEDGNPGNPATAEATVGGDPNPRAFIFAMGIKSAPSS